MLSRACRHRNAQIYAFVAHPAGMLFLFTVISLSLWHASHRILLSLHDLGLHSEGKLLAWLCYGGAAAGSLITLYYLLQL